MIRTLLHLARTGTVTQRELFPDLPEYSRGLPMVTEQPCAGGCSACAEACPTDAIALDDGGVALDRGRCIACGGCVESCPTGTIVADRRTAVAVRRREDLVLRAPAAAPPLPTQSGTRPAPFLRSLHVRSVSTGDNASDLELQASGNPIFDSSRFGVHIVASPRAADCLVVTGPVGRAMKEPLRRCWEAMAEPRLVVAAGASAISGAPHSGGYAEADGVDAVLPVDVYVPGHPPHPWSIIHGLVVAMKGGS
jgi:Ni,Fe-hydrogenase III small subunit/NAD-dependent dihydropyrimidine dehydrogenase PreA subunit